MRERLLRQRDRMAGVLMMVLGLGAAYAASAYPRGTLSRMGPGFLPLVLGLVLALLGLLIAAPGGGAATEEAEAIPVRADWRGWGCVVAGPVLFIAGAHWFGMAPATFACVFVAALGDRTATLRGSATLAAVITALGVLIFAVVLGVPMPIWRLP